MRTQENKEKYKEYDHKYYIKNRRPKTKIGQAEAKICQLKQQLAELKEKDNYHLRYELAGADETITNLKQQLAEKDKEIAHLKDFIGCKGCLDVIKKSNDNQTQLAIQELEKVKELVKDKSAWQSPFGLLKIQESDVEQIIDQQIKELKGEKDVED